MTLLSTPYCRGAARRLLILLALGALALPGHAAERDRAKVPDKYKWNLAEIYADEAAWRAAKDKLQSGLPQLRQFNGKLASSAATLADALGRNYEFDQELSRLYVYAGALADQDTRDSRHEGMRREMTQLASALRAEASYIEPEVLRFPQGTVARFLAAEPRLAVYRFYLEDIARRAAHTLTDSEEKLLAEAGPLASAPSSVYGILADADFPYPTVTLSDGVPVKLNQSAFSKLRAAPDRADRRTVMSAFFGSLGAFSRTFGTTMNGEVQKTLFFSKARKYGSTLEAALDAPNVPLPVYARLIEGVNRQLPTFHRYLKLRKRLMGLDQLNYFDLYAPLVGSVKLEYTPEEAQREVLAAVAPLGKEYQSVLERAFKERWIDYLPTDGKRSGAYSNGGAYAVHPYMLLNHNGEFDDVGTLAHELGHAMQSYFSNKTQPYPLADYPIFVAEVASTFNEALLIDHMLAKSKDPALRMSILGHYLEQIKGTVFRQTQFAEFELRMHEMAQKGQPLTGETLAKLYLEITRRYYGHDLGVCAVDYYIAHEWSYIPHFYREFYVYQYATSFTASAALAEKVKAGAPGAQKRYLSFLAAGGSKYPIDLLKEAGVDMTTDEPLALTMKTMNRVMDEMEKLLAANPNIGRR